MTQTVDPDLEITTTGERQYGKDDKIPFKIDGVTFVFLRPKAIMLAQVAATLDLNRPLDQGENFHALLQYVGRMLTFVEDTPRDENGEATGRSLLEQRLASPSDPLDLDDLLPLLAQVLRGWLKDRPTGPSRESGARREESPVDASEASTSSPPDATSTT